MAVRRQGERWAVEFQQGGMRVFRRLPPKATKEQAVALETKLRRDVFDRVSLGKSDEILLSEAIAQWLQNVVPHLKDRKAPGQKAVLLAPFVGNRKLREVAEVARDATLAWTASKPNYPPSWTPLAPATVNRRLCVLKATAKYAFEQNWIDMNLSGRIKLLKEENQREVYLTAAQVRKLAKAAPSPTTKAAIMLAAYTGLRASELLSMTSHAPSAQYLSVLKSKTGSPRNVPVAGPARRYLSALPLDMSYDQFYDEFDLARKAAGMTHVNIHDLRHTCASLLANAGVDLYVIGKILGHKNPATTQRYAHLADATLQNAMRRLK